MQTAILSNMLWLPKLNNEAYLRDLRTRLVVATVPFRGPSEKIEMFEETSEFLGVPRAWGLRQTYLRSRFEIDDQTRWPHMSWPEFSGEYRSGQRDSVIAITQAFVDDEKYGALLEAPCGSGKTILGLAIAANLQTPTLILVHKDDLAKQWHEAAELFPGAIGGHVQGNHWDYKGKHFVTAMAQTLYSRRGREPKGFYETFGCVIYDEGHRYPARTFESVMRLSPARYRFGCSATWRRSDGVECIWNWHVGYVEHQMRAVRLTGEYSQIAWNTRVTDKMFRRGRFINSAQYITSIAENAPYTQWIAEQALAGAKAGRQVLVCSHRIAQLESLKARILRSGQPVTVGYYAGKVEGKKITNEQLQAAKTCQIVLATFAKVSEGTDIPTLDTLILATPAASIEQIVGRIQRIDENKRPLLVVDPVWQTKYNQALAAKRRKVYKKLGFTQQEEKSNE